jgi:hypothetical protein
MIKLSHTLSEHQDHDLKLFQRSVSISLYIRYLKQKQGHTPQAILTVRIYLSYFYFIIKKIVSFKRYASRDEIISYLLQTNEILLLIGYNCLWTSYEDVTLSYGFPSNSY